MSIFHIFRKYFASFAEKRLVFDAETPEPAPTPQVDKPDAEGQTLDARWAKVQKEGEQEIEAAAGQIKDDIKAGKKDEEGPGKAVIGEVTYADAAGNKASFTPAQPDSKVDAQAADIAKGLNEASKETEDILASVGPLNTPTGSTSEETLKRMSEDSQEKSTDQPGLSQPKPVYAEGKKAEDETKG